MAVAEVDTQAPKSGSVERLYRAVEAARSGMGDFRTNRLEDIRRIAGNAYNKESDQTPAEETSGINMMRFALYIYTRMFSPRSPQCLMVTRDPTLKRAAKELQLATNTAVEGMNLARTIEQCVMQAMTSIGVIKVGRTSVENYSIPDYKGASYPYACNVDFDDFVFDMYARRWEDMEFIGNFYRVRYDDLEDDESYNQETVKKLSKQTKRLFDEQGSERAETISRGQDEGQDEMYDYVDLVDIYVPRSKVLYTCSADFRRNLKPLRTAKWEGPPEGPYLLLWFYSLDGQLMPIPPSSFWREMHDLVKNLFIKLSEQALRAKQIGFADISNLNDAEKVRDAKDGEIIPVRSPQSVSQQTYGGVDNNTAAFTQLVLTLFNRLNWNIEVVAGLGPAANTLGQEEMISAAANKQLQDMQERVLELVAGTMRSIGWCILTDPLVEIPITFTLDGYPDVAVHEKYTPDNQAGTILDFRTEVHPYSWKVTTPAARLASINTFVQSVVVPLGQMMAARGFNLDWEKFVDLWSQYAQLPEIKDLVTFDASNMPPDPAEAGGGQMPGAGQPMPKPQNTTRNYVRRNVKDTSPDAERMQMMQTLMASGGGQNGQANR